MELGSGETEAGKEDIPVIKYYKEKNIRGKLGASQ